MTGPSEAPVGDVPDFPVAFPFLFMVQLHVLCKLILPALDLEHLHVADSFMVVLDPMVL